MVSLPSTLEKQWTLCEPRHIVCIRIINQHIICIRNNWWKVRRVLTASNVDNPKESNDEMVRADKSVEAFRSLVRTARRLRSQIKPMLKEWGVTGSQFSTLRLIPEEGIAQTNLADRAASDPATLTGVIDRLERQGLVRRERSTQDRRVIQVFLTERGTELVEALTPKYVQVVATMMTPLNDEELDLLRELTEKLRRGLGERK